MYTAKLNDFLLWHYSRKNVSVIISVKSLNANLYNFKSGELHLPSLYLLELKKFSFSAKEELHNSVESVGTKKPQSVFRSCLNILLKLNMVCIYHVSTHNNARRFSCIIQF
jgi:hypothetical protein